ncbi:DNA-binding transcriptional LysR family regulator [Mycobacterium frederiksbergense]|uniref:DNA-binding transcriptional LysR family regulator n=1 Tax=Mycolicibacterium frederiksbergense TaxID=117567 RepID=A0ABT6KXU4_9MYCO|nr:LysR family transcriptional regulator [Mycolicibacterium frederiksbergense]MDH6195510.1 DNA-binding transcriptional LysR family regulator [Mycolicibacterium frederiksbergense]
MLDLHRLVLLREVQLRGGITAAARSLSYTHSAVSQQLGLLEKEAGVPLLEKVGRGVRLTPAAVELVHHAEDILAILERAESDLAASDKEVRGTLRVAGFTTISRIVVPQVISTLTERHPALDIRYRQVEPEDGLLLLSSRRIDVLIADSYPGISEAIPADLYAELLISDPIRAYLPEGTEVTSPDGLRRVRWVLEPSGTEANAWTRRWCHRHGFEPDVAYESADLLFHLRMVQSGLAAAFLPDLLVRHADALEKPTTLLDTHQQRHISLVCRAGAEHRPSIVACRDAFVAHLVSPASG